MRPTMLRTMRAVAVPLQHAQPLRRELYDRGLVDRTVRMRTRDRQLLIPVRDVPGVDLVPFGAHLVEAEAFEPRTARTDPRTHFGGRLRALGVPGSAIPRRWERLGDVIILRLAQAARPHAETIARVVGETLRARTVVEDRSGIHGPFREPDVRVLWGDGTDTTHVEDGIRFRLDVARVMFSSGNLAERSSIARRVRPGEVVVDLFAGIGYFALPIAILARPEQVYACEINPVAYDYLLENVRINRAASIVPRLGDCRVTAPSAVADWVLMGHFEADRYLDVAFRCLADDAHLVYHQLCPEARFPSDMIGRVADEARRVGRRLRSFEARVVKGYAPGIVHAVLEARVARP